MGLFDHFPYTNVHELNLDWVLSMMKALEAEWEAFTAGNSLTFADPMLHDISKTYAKNTIVLDSNGNAYVSLQAVPVGVGLQNGDYWLMVFDYEAFIEKVNKNFTARYYRGSYRATSDMAIGDWLTVDDVLCKATAAIAIDDILEVGVNIEHFTLEDFIKAFMQSANQLIQQYKNDIDASELLYRQQLAQDIANTTASLQAQLDLAISGATVDSEVINARLGADGVTYATLGDAIRTQVGALNDVAFPQANERIIPIAWDQQSIYDKSLVLNASKAISNDIITITLPAVWSGNLEYRIFGSAYTPIPALETKTGVDNTYVVEFWATVSTANFRIVLTDGNTNEIHYITDGHNKFSSQLNLTRVYFLDTVNTDVGATLVLGGITLYQGDIGFNPYPAYETKANATLINEISGDAEKIINDRVVIHNYEMLDIGSRAIATNCSKSYDANQITFSTPAVWSGNVNGVMFGLTSTPIVLSNDTDGVEAQIVIDFYLDTDISTLRLVFQDTSSNVTVKYVTSGHNRLVSPYTDIAQLYFLETNNTNVNKYFTVSNLILYQGSENLNPWDYVYTEKNRAFMGKRFLTIGDSLTNAAGYPDLTRWQNLIVQEFKMRDYSTSGAIGLTVAKYGADSIYDHVMALNTTDSSVGLISFWGGTNDYTYSIAISTLNDQLDPLTRDNTTFYGALLDCVEHLLTLYPDIPFFMVGTTPRIYDVAQSKNYNNTVNSAGYSLDDYIAAVKTVAKYYGLPFIDLCRDSGINLYNITSFMYQQSAGGIDYYLHFTDAGEIQVSKILRGFINGTWLDSLK